MGRKKIQISRITDERNRQVTFNKRKFGVMKKAYELSVLCDCEIALIIFSSSNKLYQYASTDMDKVLLKYTEYNEPHESLTNKNIIEKENKNGTMSPDSPDPDDSYNLTPRTEAKYSKIDEDFQLMMQRNQQQLTTASRGSVNSGNSYMPVTVPVGSYGDANMLQTSPQIAHQNISPRPSSSEDSVYPTGNMLEISNGYPHSTSPAGGSPSPTVGMPVHLSKGLQSTHKHSPGNQSGKNLRVVIPMTSNANSNDGSYSEQNRHAALLNTPVVTLQTPIPGLSNYNVNTFGAQDFSMSSNDMSNIMSNTWTSSHQSMGSLNHPSGIPHLAISNSTPPPVSSSPVPVKIKSEPISPPRDQIVSSHQLQQHHQHHSRDFHSGQQTSLGISHTASSSLSNTLTPTQLMSSRPSSTGHLTPNSGSVTPTNLPSPSDLRHSSSVGASSLPDYESPNNGSHKRPRISEGWTS